MLENGTLIGGTRGFTGSGENRTFLRLRVVATEGINLFSGENDSVEDCVLIATSLGINMNACTQCPILRNRIEGGSIGVRRADVVGEQVRLDVVAIALQWKSPCQYRRI